MGGLTLAHNEKVLLPCFSHGIQYGVSGRSEQLKTKNYGNERQC
jgi:hypothetical protein